VKIPTQEQMTKAVEQLADLPDYQLERINATIRKALPSLTKNEHVYYFALGLVASQLEEL
jgi:hypothetical protein